MTHKLCSDHCFNRYRMANGLIMNCCEQCGEYLPSKGAGNNVLVVDGQQKRFCCQSCVTEYKQVIYVLKTKPTRYSFGQTWKHCSSANVGGFNYIYLGIPVNFMVVFK
jgi:hypothetical protein